MRLLRLTNLLRVLLAAGIVASFVLSCSDDKPTNPNNPPKGNTGVLLEGDATGNAVDATIDKPPIPADQDDILDDGLILTRVDAVINLAATVTQVNQALQAHDCRISCMLAGSPFVTLMVPKLADRAAADTLAATLRATGAFGIAFAAYQPQPTATFGEAMLPGGSADDGLRHLYPISVPSAWNARRAIQGGDKIKVMVPDIYYSSSPSPEITAQRFLAGGGAVNSALTSGNEYVGNHGFHVSGIIGANFDSVRSTGIHPGAATRLDIQSFHVGGLSWSAMINGTAQSIAANFPNGKFVLNTSLGYNDPQFTSNTRYQRSIQMIQWRLSVQSHVNRFFHATAAGNDGTVAGVGGTADFGSPFNIAVRFASPWEVIGTDSLGAADSAVVNDLITMLQNTAPNSLIKSSNVLIVGATDPLGAPTAFSSRGHDISAIGDSVWNVCVIADPAWPGSSRACDGQVARFPGTSMATPQVAGLAAYMWSINPSLSVADIKARLLAAYNGTMLDAYQLILGLDNGLTNPTVRKAILDVAGATEIDTVPNNAFDEHDLAMYLDKFAEYEALGGIGGPDYSRWDLNGNGMTGNPNLAVSFDLNADGAYGFVIQNHCDSTMEYEEVVTTDHDILEYYAYSELYSGDPAIRDSLLECGPPRIIFTFEVDREGWIDGFTTAENSWGTVRHLNLDGKGVIKLDGSDGGTSNGVPNSWIYRDIDIPEDVTTLRYEVSPHNRDSADTHYRIRFVVGGTQSHTIKDWETLFGDEGVYLWEWRTIDISAFAGQTVTVYFEQGDNNTGQHEQVYLDNISFE